MLLPDMVTGGPGENHRRRSLQQTKDAFFEGSGSDSPRHVVMTARSGAWAASGQAHKVIPVAINEEE